ncbi:hypothetical protein [uncultured Anaerovibrio sp.]|uniref:hypothetical protein n=1 Tax=uncultured Anaerovibrio sp. TaxID=361586 RepID=UPI0025F0323E|nr:hypothetical protein [uncultured Anaerovibrio sp.]
MGFFSAIGGAISSFCSGVGRAVSSGIRAVGNAISTTINGAKKALETVVSVAKPFLGGLAKKAVNFLAGTLKIIAGPLGPVISPPLIDIIIKVVTLVISVLAEKNEVVEKNEKPEEIGYRLQEAEKEEHKAWKQREDFKTFKEYYQYLKEQIPEINQEKLEERREFYSMLGTQAEVRALEEKFGLRIPEAALLEVGRAAMTAKEVQVFMQVFRNLGYRELLISDYLKGSLPGSELERITAALLDALQLYFPDKKVDELQRRLVSMQRISADDKILPAVYKDELREIYGDAIAKSKDAGELDEAGLRALSAVEEGKVSAFRLEKEIDNLEELHFELPVKDKTS